MKAIVSDSSDSRLDYLIEFGNMCHKMISVPKKRVKQLTRDTALAVHQTCNGLVDLTRHLLSTTHSYVALGKYTTDKLEKSFLSCDRVRVEPISYLCNKSLKN